MKCGLPCSQPICGLNWLILLSLPVRLCKRKSYPHYALPLERLLRCARKRILLRESLGDELVIRYTPDPYLDEGKRYIRVYHNMYPLQEVMAFMQNYGFQVTRVFDKRSQDGVEMVVDIPHYWRILLGERE